MPLPMAQDIPHISHVAQTIQLSVAPVSRVMSQAVGRVVDDRDVFRELNRKLQET